MSANPVQVWQPERLLLVASELLHRSFVEATRADAKRLFRDIEDGKQVGVARLELEDQSQLLIKLTLDKSEFRGKFNFRVFRQSLELLIAQIATLLQQGQKEFNSFTAESGEMMFLIPSITRNEQGEENALVLGVGQLIPGELPLQLQFIEPSQLRPQHDDATVSA